MKTKLETDQPLSTPVAAEAEDIPTAGYTHVRWAGFKDADPKGDLRDLLGRQDPVTGELRAYGGARGGGKTKAAYDTRWSDLERQQGLHPVIVVDPGQDEGSKVTLFTKSPGGELTEIAQVDAAEIAPNVTGGSITLTGVEPGDIVWDKRGLPVGMVDDRSALVRAGFVEGGRIHESAGGAIRGVLEGLGATALAAAHYGQIMAAAVDEVRRVIDHVRESYGGQSWSMFPTLTMSEWTWNRLTHTTYRGKEATRWIQSLTPTQRSHLRLISTPQYPVLNTKRVAKKRRIAEAKMRSWYRSFHGL